MIDRKGEPKRDWNRKRSIGRKPNRFNLEKGTDKWIKRFEKLDQPLNKIEEDTNVRIH